MSLPTKFVSVSFRAGFETFTAVLPNDKEQLFSNAIASYQSKSRSFSFLEKILIQCNGFFKN